MTTEWEGIDTPRELPKGYRVVKNGLKEYWLQISEPRTFRHGHDWYNVQDVDMTGSKPYLFTPTFGSEQEAIDWTVKRHEESACARLAQKLREQITVVRENV